MFWLFENDAWKSQKMIILEMLQKNKEVTPSMMMRAWISRYGAHIFNLRKAWHKIDMREEIKRDAKWKNYVSIHTFYTLQK